MYILYSKIKFIRNGSEDEIEKYQKSYKSIVWDKLKDIKGVVPANIEVSVTGHGHGGHLVKFNPLLNLLGTLSGI